MNTGVRQISRRLFLLGTFAATLAGLPLRQTAAGGGCNQGFHGEWTCQANLRSALVGQVAEPQYQNHWCWAACISMVFGYFGRRVSQPRIVQETFGSVLNLPAYPQQILRQLNRDWIDDLGRKFTATGSLLPFRHELVAAALMADHPLIVGALGHTTVLTRYRWREDATGHHLPLAALVLDPALDGKIRGLTPEELKEADFLAFVDVA